MFTKSAEWSHEKEWRLMLALDAESGVPASESDRVRLFSIPPTAITGVILGARCTDETREKARQVLQSNDALSHVELREAVMSADRFALAIADVTV